MLRENPLIEKSFKFALRIVKLYKYLTSIKHEYVLSKQVLRSGTNPGAMIRESINAESNSDFIHKLSIGLKEIGETEYWLELLYHSDYINETEFLSIKKDAIEVGKLLTSSIKTTKKNLNDK
jgi:four helix bundle protein